MVVRAMLVLVRAMVVAVRAKVVAAPSLPPEVHQAHPPVRVALDGHEGSEMPAMSRRTRYELRPCTLTWSRPPASPTQSK